MLKGLGRNKNPTLHLKDRFSLKAPGYWWNLLLRLSKPTRTKDTIIPNIYVLMTELKKGFRWHLARQYTTTEGRRAFSQAEASQVLALPPPQPSPALIITQGLCCKLDQQMIRVKKIQPEGLLCFEFLNPDNYICPACSTAPKTSAICTMETASCNRRVGREGANRKGLKQLC